jgi:hypothetical protein
MTQRHAAIRPSWLVFVLAAAGTTCLAVFTPLCADPPACTVGCSCKETGGYAVSIRGTYTAYACYKWNAALNQYEVATNAHSSIHALGGCMDGGPNVNGVKIRRCTLASPQFTCSPGINPPPDWTVVEVEPPTTPPEGATLQEWDQRVCLPPQQG